MKSVDQKGATYRAQPRLTTKTAKERGGSRKDDLPDLVGAWPLHADPSSGKPMYYLGFCCGEGGFESSTASFFAVLTEIWTYPILARLTRECHHFPSTLNDMGANPGQTESKP